MSFNIEKYVDEQEKLQKDCENCEVSFVNYYVVENSMQEFSGRESEPEDNRKRMQVSFGDENPAKKQIIEVREFFPMAPLYNVDHLPKSKYYYYYYKFLIILNISKFNLVKKKQIASEDSDGKYFKFEFTNLTFCFR